MIALKEIKESLLHFLFPHICIGCGSDTLALENFICLRCMNELPFTKFENIEGNPVEKIFYGRLPLSAASAQFYFTKESIVQRLMHEFKYRGNKDVGFELGKIMGDRLIKSGRFEADALVPMPLFAGRERRRGYNQAAVICEGMSAIMGIPVLNKAVIRPETTDTQTRKSRVERWQNIEGKFMLQNPGAVRNKHLLLVDDVITTGATIEACGLELLKGENTRLSVAALSVASH